MDAIKIIKRVVLTALTLLVVLLLSASLIESFNQPQIQSRLELYQTNLLLHAAEYQGESPNDPTATTMRSLIGEKPFEAALKQYQEVLESTQKTLETTRDRLESTVVVAPPAPQIPTPPLVEGSNPSAQQQQQLKTQISKLESSQEELLLKIGILQAHQGELEKARETWTQLSDRTTLNQDSTAITARALLGIWENDSQILRSTEEIITQNLDGWFRYAALEKLYQILERDRALAELQATEQEAAREAVVKLTIVSAIPGLGFFIGMILLIGLGVQWFLKRQDSFILQNSDRRWETPWDWEIIWQVFIVGFFFVGQVAVPLALGFLGVKPATFDVRSRAFYILATYILLASGGLGVLFLSIKSFLPLPKEENWFRFNFGGKWVLWGLGGYFAALPLVIVVSLINQQIWQGQGGSNPILPIALEGKDNVALTIFFITASLAAPLFEETMFRGFLLPSLTRYMSVTSAIVLSSLLFALAHLNLSEVLPLATLGIVLGVVYTRSRNLLAPILLHSLWNSGTLLSLFVLGSGSN